MFFGGAAAAAEPEWGLATGYGFSAHFTAGATTNERLLLFAPSVGFPMSGRLEWVVEGHFAQYFAPSGYMVGIVPIALRYCFGGGSLRPYVFGGGGGGWTSLEALPEIDRRFNFILEGAVGVRGAIANGQAWTLEARLVHYSNAHTEEPNLGLNSIVFLAGWRF